VLHLSGTHAVRATAPVVVSRYFQRGPGLDLPGLCPCQHPQHRGPARLCVVVTGAGSSASSTRAHGAVSHFVSTPERLELEVLKIVVDELHVVQGFDVEGR
jgi:hypothetical protein